VAEFYAHQNVESMVFNKVLVKVDWIYAAVLRAAVLKQRR